MPLEQTLISFPDASKGYKCSCCGSYVRQYTRKFNSNMGIALKALYDHKVNGFVKVEDFLLANGYKRCGDFSYLTHYRLIERMQGKREDNSNRNGYYRLTSLGIMFCEQKWKVQEKFIIFNNKLIGFEGKEVDIKDILKEKFSFQELMQNN